MKVPLAIVTATTNPERALDCIRSWETHAKARPLLVGVLNGTERPASLPFDVVLDEGDYVGTVPAFQRGVNHLLNWPNPPEIIACLHDDFRIDEPGWDQKVTRHFDRNPACGLLGFGGAVGLGADELYTVDYNPMQLARIGFRSNLDDAENHGLRSLLAERVACLDGFSQVGCKEFWDGYRRQGGPENNRIRWKVEDRPWDILHDIGMVHHFYDGALGCIAKRHNWETWYLPLRGHHFGGRTAVGDQGYAEWAKGQTAGGDQGFWTAAHEIGYHTFRAELPIRI